MDNSVHLFRKEILMITSLLVIGGLLVLDKIKNEGRFYEGCKSLWITAEKVGKDFLQFIDKGDSNK
tara:strand:+ start:185 stop:382 length:198 start_codon:yes stop_codon:yes gene_type:complete